MEAAKEKALHEIDLHFEAVFSKFNQRLHTDDYASIELLDRTLSSLEIQHRRVSAIPTWPWRGETAQFVQTAVALPFILAVLRFIVERAFNG